MELGSIIHALHHWSFLNRYAGVTIAQAEQKFDELVSSTELRLSKSPLSAHLVPLSASCDVFIKRRHSAVRHALREPIVKKDSDTKNDCERNAAKRLLSDLRREHPHLKVLIVQDGLASNFSHLSLLDSLNMQYVIGVKQGDHAYLFDWIKNLKPMIHEQIDEKGTQHKFHTYSNVPLNDAHHDYRVNVLEYWEIKKDGRKQYFSWVTKLPLTPEKVYQIMRAGRARWKIENETFNTLKNQGYNFEHNYGHGYKNLCSVMTMLMMLAFLIDQVQQLCCKKYQKARKHVGTLRRFFEKIRNRVDIGAWDSWDHLLTFVGDPASRHHSWKMVT
jgi:hypothetical protein